MILDGHAHVFAPYSSTYPREVDEAAWAARSAPIELLESTMVEANVSGGILVPLGTESRYTTAMDRYIAEVLQSRSSRFAGVAVAEQGQTDPGVVDERLTRGGFDGLRLFRLSDHGDDIQEHPWYPVLRQLSTTGRKLWLYPALDDLLTVEKAIRALPDLRVVLNHCGITQSGIRIDSDGMPRVDIDLPPPGQAMVESLAQFPNVYVMISSGRGFSHESYPYLDIAPVVQRLGVAYGAARLMWGSDFPWIIDDPGYKACIDLVDVHFVGLSAGERASLLGGTCSHLFGLHPPPR